MKITRRRYDLTPETVLIRNTGLEVITAPYDPHHDWYLTQDLTETDNGDLAVVPGSENRVTPADLIGASILCSGLWN